MPEIYSFEREHYLEIDGTNQLIGEGVLSLKTSTNPQTKTKQYIHDKNARGGLSGYQPTMTLTAEGYSGDPVMDYIMELGRTLKLGDNVKTKLTTVDRWTDSNGAACKAVQRAVVISVTDPGSNEGGNALTVEVTISADGDPVIGTFAVSTKKFTKTEA